MKRTPDSRRSKGKKTSVLRQAQQMAKKRAEMEMRHNNLFVSLGRVACLALFVFFWSCEGHLFDSGSREIAHGYRLKRTGDPAQFALIAPYDTGGIIIDEIGWRKPFIIARASGSEYWDRIDTDHAEHTRISDSQRTSNPNYRTIPVENAEVAWNNLKPHKRLW
jgi:hypothetical protein